MNRSEPEVSSLRKEKTMQKYLVTLVYSEKMNIPFLVEAPNPLAIGILVGCDDPEKIKPLPDDAFFIEGEPSIEIRPAPEIGETKILRCKDCGYIRVNPVCTSCASPNLELVTEES